MYLTSRSRNVLLYHPVCCNLSKEAYICFSSSLELTKIWFSSTTSLLLFPEVHEEVIISKCNCPFSNLAQLDQNQILISWLQLASPHALQCYLLLTQLFLENFPCFYLIFSDTFLLNQFYLQPSFIFGVCSTEQHSVILVVQLFIICHLDLLQ